MKTVLFFRFFHNEVIPCTFKSSRTAGRNTFGPLSSSGIWQPKIRIIQNFGNKEKLLAEDPKTLQELQKIVTDENGTALILRLKDFPDTEAAIPAREDPPFQNQMIWDRLKLDSFFQYRQGKAATFQLQAKIPLALMTGVKDKRTKAIYIPKFKELPKNASMTLFSGSFVSGTVKGGIQNGGIFLTGRAKFCRTTAIGSINC